MPEIVIPYKPRELQNFLHKKIDKSRFSVIVAHRRSGKTVMLVNHMIKAALTCPLPNPRYAFISPTFKHKVVQRYYRVLAAICQNFKDCNSYWLIKKHRSNIEFKK